MYDEFFSLSGPPFPALPSANRYCPTGPSTRCLEILTRVIRRGEGPALLIGPPGVGKSAVLHALKQRLAGDIQAVFLRQNRVGSRRDFLQQLLFELGLPYDLGEEGALRLGLRKHLDSVEDCPRGLALLIDDADALPEKIYDELLMLGDLARDGDPLVHVVLAGGFQLEETLSLPGLISFQQRIAARCYLEPLSRNETAGYVCQRFAEAGGDPELFADQALRAIHEQTGGVPRLINQLANQVLVLAARQQQHRVDVDHVLEAWAELQQLPAGRTQRPAAASSDRVLEFGQLDEDLGAALPSDEAEADSDSVDERHSAAPSKSDSRAIDDFESVTDPQATLDRAQRRVAQAQAAEFDIEEPTELETQESGNTQLMPAVKAVDAGREANEAAPPKKSGPTITAARGPVEDPFGRFESEEIIIDRFSSLDLGPTIVGGYVTITAKHPARSWLGSALRVADPVSEETSGKTELMPTHGFAETDVWPAGENCRPLWPPQSGFDSWPGAELAGEPDATAEVHQPWPPTSLEPPPHDRLEESDVSVTEAWVRPHSDRSTQEPASETKTDATDWPAKVTDCRSDFFDRSRDDRDIIIVDESNKEDDVLAVQRYRALLEKMRRG